MKITSEPTNRYDLALNVISDYFEDGGSYGDIYVKCDVEGDERAFHYNIPQGTNLVRWFYDSGIYQDYLYDSDKFNYEEGADWSVSPVADVNAYYSEHQVYRDNKYNNCLLRPIRVYFENLLVDLKEKLKTVNTRANKQKIYATNGIIRKIKVFEEEYKNGVPNDKLDVITSKLNINIYIFDIMKEVEIKSVVIRPLKAFKFINTRFNHVTQVCFNTNATPKVYLTKKDFVKKRKKLAKSDEFYTFTNNMLITLDAIYTIEGYNFEEFEENNKNCPLMRHMEYFHYPELSNFVRESCHYGGSINFDLDKNIELIEHKDGREKWYEPIPEKGKKIKHIDHIKSYANYEECQYFDKYKFSHIPSVFMAVPKNFNYQKYNGFFLIKDINDKNVNKNIRDINNRLAIYNEDNVYSAPELNFIEDLGYTFTIVAGAISFENSNFDYSLIKTPNYSIWAGFQSSINLDKRYYIKGDKKIAENIKHKHKIDVKLIGDNTICIVARKVKCLHRSHLTSYILAYSRIQILTQLYNIDCKKLIKIQLDGIYYFDEDYNGANIENEYDKIEIIKTFKTKEIKLKLNGSCDNYFNTYHSRLEYPDYNRRLLNDKLLIVGSGGSGKTHYFLTQKQFNDLIYVAPSNKLCMAKKLDYDVESVTINKLLGIRCQPCKIHANILVDEASMLTIGIIEALINYKINNKITLIIAGDIGFQIKPYIPEGQPIYSSIAVKKLLKKEGYKKIVFKTNYRCKDEKLAELLKFTRKTLRRKTIKRIEANQIIINKFKELSGRDVNKSTILLNSDIINDNIMSSTHERINYLTKIINPNIEANDMKKWVVNFNSLKYCNGDIIVLPRDDKPDGYKEPKTDKKNTTKTPFEERYIFTVHVCQGLTCYNKIYIDIVKLFDIEILYTALSRAQYLDQIVLLN